MSSNSNNRTCVFLETLVLQNEAEGLYTSNIIIQNIIKIHTEALRLKKLII